MKSLLGFSALDWHHIQLPQFHVSQFFWLAYSWQVHISLGNAVCMDLVDGECVTNDGVHAVELLDKYISHKMFLKTVKFVELKFL